MLLENPIPFKEIKYIKFNKLMEIFMPYELVTFYALHPDIYFHEVLLIVTLLFIKLMRKYKN